MSSRWRFLVTLGWSLLGCSAGSPRVPPARALTESWQPARVLRESLQREGLQREGAGEIVLDDKDGLSPDEAAIFAIDQNPRLRVVRAERGIARAELVAAGVLPNPRLEGSIDVPVSGADARVLGYGAGLSWNVSPLLARGARRTAAEQNLAAVDLEVAWQEWQVAQAARLHAIRAIYLERRVLLARELEQTWQQRLTGLRQAQADHAVTELEVTSAESSFAEARVTRLELDQRLVAERVELNGALGINVTQAVVLDTSFHLAGTEPPAETLLGELPRRRLDLLGLERAQRSQEGAVQAALIARFPPLEVGLQTARGVDGLASAGVTLSFEIPFFERNQAGVARERARQDQVQVEYTARLLEARADVARTLVQLPLVREQLSASRDASAAAQKLDAQARAARTSGASSLLLSADILERSYASQLRVLEIEQALAELQLALEVASGRELR